MHIQPGAQRTDEATRVAEAGQLLHFVKKQQDPSATLGQCLDDFADTRRSGCFFAAKAGTKSRNLLDPRQPRFQFAADAELAGKIQQRKTEAVFRLRVAIHETEIEDGKIARFGGGLDVVQQKLRLAHAARGEQGKGADHTFGQHRQQGVGIGAAGIVKRVVHGGSPVVARDYTVLDRF